MNDTVLGLIAAGVPLLLIGIIALRRLPAVLAFFVVLVGVGLGYLHTTGTVRDIGHKVRVALPAGLIPEHKGAADTTAATPATPAEAPAMAPATPATPPSEMAPATPAPAPAPAPTTP